MTDTNFSEISQNLNSNNDQSFYNFDSIKSTNIPSYDSIDDFFFSSPLGSLVVSAIKENRNIEDFIEAKDAYYINLKQEELSGNPKIINHKENIDKATQSYTQGAEEVNNLKNTASALEKLLKEVNEIKEKVLPEINDELIASLKIENVNTVNEYRQYIYNKIDNI